MIATQSIEEFLSAVASSAVAPSAGAVTAVTGALAASISEMVCLHLPADETPPRLAAARDDLETGRDRLLALADEDAETITAVRTAFEATDESDHEAALLRRTTEIPLRIAEVARDVADAAAVVAAHSPEGIRTDAVVGAHLARAAVASAAAIVRTNLDLLADESFVADARRRLETAESDAAAAVASITADADD